MIHAVQITRGNRPPIGEDFTNVLMRAKRYFRTRKEFIMVPGGIVWAAESIPVNGSVPDNAILFRFINGRWEKQ